MKEAIKRLYKAITEEGVSESPEPVTYIEVLLIEKVRLEKIHATAVKENQYDIIGEVRNERIDMNRQIIRLLQKETNELSVPYKTGISPLVSKKSVNRKSIRSFGRLTH